MASSLVSTVTNTLAVNPIGRVRGLEAFSSGHLWTPYGARGVFGGQVVAQSLMAAINTVEDNKDLHSQHVGVFVYNREGADAIAVLLPPSVCTGHDA